MAESITPKMNRSRPSKIPQTPINIPPSPFMKKLGFGSGVSVFRWDRSPRTGSNRSPWALKKLNHRNVPPFIQERLEMEANVLQNLHHPNIVGFRACLPGKDGRVALAMESCGTSLGNKIEDQHNAKGGPFEASIILKVALGMARALDYLHSVKKILHGDIKSFNILIKGEYEEIKLCDFGVSLELKPNGEVVDPDSFVGTSVWSPPEATGLIDAPISSKVDIFAFGLVLWEMIALTLPHCDDLNDNDDDTVWEDNVENLIGTRPALPPVDLDDSYNAIMEMFYCCTEQDPSIRPSAGVLVEWIEDLTGEPPLQLENMKGID